MYKELTILLNKSAENDEVVTFVLTANGDFFSSGNDILATIESKSTFVEDALTIIK